MSDARLPLPVECMLRECAEQLALSQRNFKSKQVRRALNGLTHILREYGQRPWPPKGTHDSQNTQNASS